MRIWSDDAGMTTLPTVVGASFALVMFVFLANLVLVQYGRGVAATAVDEAVRRGAISDTDQCRDRARAVLADLLGGPFGADLQVECWEEGLVVQAVVHGRLPALVPFMADFAIDARAALPREMS